MAAGDGTVSVELNMTAAEMHPPTKANNLERSP